MEIHVRSASGAYPIVIRPGALSDLGELIGSAAIAGPPVAVSCRPVWQRHGKRMRAVLQGQPPILIPDGEPAKRLSTVAALYQRFAARRLERAGAVIAFGGGVVGDVAGFAAATYLRGVRVIQVPTTLLAQVDSAIGGKVGVNLPAGKNLVGAFHAPALVVCDPAVLTTLPAREFRSGLHEVIKYGVIASPSLFDHVSRSLPAILTQAPDATSEIIAECCAIKARVVGDDEREQGHRRVLNFGHTVGHALEAITGYRRFRHGEAIAHGMLAAAHLSRARGTLTTGDLARLHDLIGRVGTLPPVGDLRTDAVLAAIRRDKKVEHGRLQFVLANGIGATSIVADVTAAELRRSMLAIGMK